MRTITADSLRLIKNELITALQDRIQRLPYSWMERRFLEALHGIPIPENYSVDAKKIEEAHIALASFIYQFAIYNFHLPNQYDEQAKYNRERVNALPISVLKRICGQENSRMRPDQDKYSVELLDTIELYLEISREDSIFAGFYQRVIQKFNHRLIMTDSAFAWVQYRDCIAARAYRLNLKLKELYGIRQVTVFEKIGSAIASISAKSLETEDDARRDLVEWAAIFSQKIKFEIDSSVINRLFLNHHTSFSPDFSRETRYAKMEEKKSSLRLLSSGLFSQINDFELFRQKLLEAIQNYLTDDNISTDVAGRLRAERLKAELEEIGVIPKKNDDKNSEDSLIRSEKEREVILLACAIICPPEGTVIRPSQQLRAKIIEKQNVASYISSYRPKLLISDEELRRRANELNLVVSYTRRVIDDSVDNLERRRNKMIKIIDCYLKEHAQKDLGRTRALHLLAALESIGELRSRSLVEAQRRLYTLVYLLIQTTSSDLKHRVLFAFEWKEEDIQMIINLPRFPHIFSDISRLAHQHQLLFEKDVESLDEENITLEDDIQQLTISFDQFDAALTEYKVHDDLSEARVRNLKKSLEEIQLILDVNEQKKRLIILACALIFKSKSTNLANTLLKKIFRNSTRADSEQKIGLKKLQLSQKISDYDVWQASNEINEFTKIHDWVLFKDKAILALKNYRFSGLGGFDGNLRAQRCLDNLWYLKHKETMDQKDQYQLILNLYTVAIESKSTQLKKAILDHTGIAQKQLENLKMQMGLTDKLIEEKLNYFKGNPAQSIENFHPVGLKNLIMSAIFHVLVRNSNAAEQEVALQVKIALQKRKDEDFTLQLLSDLIRGLMQFNPVPEGMLDEICILMGVKRDALESTILPSGCDYDVDDIDFKSVKVPPGALEQSLFNFFEPTRSDECNLGAARAAVTAQSSKTLKNLSTEFYSNLRSALLHASKQYLDNNIGGKAGKNRVLHCQKALLGIADLNQENERKRLILLACAVMTGPGSLSASISGSPTKFAAKAMNYTGLSSIVMRKFQESFGISDHIRDRLAARLVSVEQSKNSVEGDDTVSEPRSDQASAGEDLAELKDILHAGLDWRVVHSGLNNAISAYDPKQNPVGISRKKLLLAELVKLDNIDEDENQKRKLALLITTMPLIDSGSLKQAVFGVISPEDAGKGYKEVVDTLLDEFFIIDAERNQIKLQMDVESVVTHSPGLFSASSATVPIAGMNFVQLKQQLISYAATIERTNFGVESAEGVNLKMVARNLLLRLTDLKDPELGDKQNTLKKLAAAFCFLDKDALPSVKDQDRYFGLKRTDFDPVIKVLQSMLNPDQELKLKKIMDKLDQEMTDQHGASSEGREGRVLLTHTL